MSITTTRLTRWAGLSAVAAGLLFIGVQINHPPLDATTITSTDVTLRSTAKLVMAVLALAGITGIYLRQVRQIGLLGLIGYLLLCGLYLLLIPIEFTAGYVLPSVADTEPAFVNDVLAVSVGGSATGYIGLLQAAFRVAGALYVAGGLVFGIALIRARVLARWPAGILIVGTVSTLALAVLPDSFNRPFAVPTGVALIGLGMSLWRDQRHSTAPATANSALPLQPTVR